MTRQVIRLSRSTRRQALEALSRAPDGYTLELREPKRSDAQNAALWSLLTQVAKARPTHNGVQMSAETWKSVFMQALGAEMVFVPTLDGTGVFPLGHRSSALTKGEFAGLIEIIIAWCAKEGIAVEHFDDQGGSVRSAPRAA